MAADEASLLPPPPPGSPRPETREGFDDRRDQTSQALQVAEDSAAAVPFFEEETSVDPAVSEESNGDLLQDVDEKPALPREQDSISAVIQALEEDSFIPPDVLDATLKGSDPAPDLSFSLHLLGTKYNDLVKRWLEKKSLEESAAPKHETLTRKYAELWAERKRLYNEVIELKGNIRVFCRCRPMNSEELSKGHSSVFEFDPSQDSELQILTTENSRKQFKFDHVFGPQDDQEAVFAETRPMVMSVLDGYNACIFAYGQTGTGKTFTMEGTLENRGVNYRTLEELFRVSEERSSLMRYEFFVSMLEVYNERIRDLLPENPNLPSKKLEVKQAAEGTQEVPGLVEAQTFSIDGVWELLQAGARNRSVGSTNANELSSRSHSLVRVTIRGENLMNGAKTRSHLWLVDLAGSERVGKIEVEGERLKESQFINRSLSALGDVIAALASKNPHSSLGIYSHLPFCNFFPFICWTLMFVQISPSSADLGETLCSLNFATRVRGIEQGPARKHADPSESFKFKQMAEKLRQEEKERARLNDTLQLLHVKYASRENVFKEKLRDLENQLAEERKARHLHQEDGNRFHNKPPLPPANQRRQPLGRISSNLPPPAQPRGSGGGGDWLAPVPEKENLPSVKRKLDNGGGAGGGATGKPPLMKARRILLAPVVRPAAAPAAGQSRRRASIAAVPGGAGDRPRARLSLAFSREVAATAGSVLRIPRRRSVMMMPLGTPDGKAGARGGGGGAAASGNKFSSPPQQGQWRSRIPSMASPRQRLRFLSSPAANRNMSSAGGGGAAQPAGGKLCFSVQKRLVVGSPLMKMKSFASREAAAPPSIIGRFGSAQRILSTNRRKSVF
ncbi:unnamed protein product [Spirodela intermedia]|uniref:Kinesin-like protein n=1 Tax=Spirodela intermedia TaxID=51605 RepID=A0A7I8KQA5_SPIIN|nr:unnamed protein product [Spirodela intermedia]